MATGTSPICFACARFAGAVPGVGWACDAFPGGIPQGILINRADHAKPFPGDRGLRYVPFAGADDAMPSLLHRGHVVEREASRLPQIAVAAHAVRLPAGWRRCFTRPRERLQLCQSLARKLSPITREDWPRHEADG